MKKRNSGVIQIVDVKKSFIFEIFFTLLENPKLYSGQIKIARHPITFEMFGNQTTVLTWFLFALT